MRSSPTRNECQLNTEIRKIYDEKNEVIVYFHQRGPDKPTMSHGAYAISTTKRRLQEEQK